jgi:hypothetical protein
MNEHLAERADVVNRLQHGGWQQRMHLKMKGWSIYQHRSLVDRRVERLTSFPTGKGTVKLAFVFEDPAVEFAKPHRKILLEPTTFLTIEDLALGIVLHDRAIADQREWEAAG